MRRFYLERSEDPTGVSGIGIIAWGIEFESGWVALHFDPCLKGVGSIYAYRDLADMFILHGHSGKTQIVWVDPV